MANTFAEYIRQSLKDAHETFEGTMKDVTSEVAHYQPGGKALSIAAAYVHTIVSEDVMLNGWVRKIQPLSEGEWADKMGLSAPHPAMDVDWEKNYTVWAKTVKVDLEKFKKYAEAVYKQSDDFLAGLTDKDMVEKKVDLSAWQMGEWPLARFVIRFLISHVDSLTGEISTVKGLQGLKGYPF